MNKFKTGVSNWELTFENGKVIDLKAVMSENVTMLASGKTKIILKNATFDTEFIDLFKEKQKVNSVKQDFQLFNNLGESVEKIEYNYLNLEIKKISIISSTDSVAEVNATLSG